MEIGPIFSWADNYDLYIASPNGIKATHAVVMEFTQHPAGIIDTGNIGVMQLTIHRLKKHEYPLCDWSTRLYSWSTIRGVQSWTHLCFRRRPCPPKSRSFSPLQSDLVSSETPRGYHKSTKMISRSSGRASMHNKTQWWRAPATRQRHWPFGPMLDSPPAHPDTVMTTLVYLQSTLNAFGMQYTHVSVDLQLYHTACPVQYNDPQRWTGLILHPCMMQTLMSFMGCIGTLMKSSGVEVLIMSAVFGCITSIMNGKAWTNALWAYHLIIAVLLRSFYSN